MKKIIEREIPKEIKRLHEHPLLHKIYAARGITKPISIDYNLKNLLPYTHLMDIEKAVSRLTIAIKEQQHILIIGDFDTDGATGTVLATLALKSFGLENISYIVPNRFLYGYGLTPEIVEVAAKKNPSIILTVDNGTNNIDGVEKANRLGIDVIITDHHLQSDDLPNAYAIINPNRHEDPFLSKFLSGVGVVFYLMIALRTYLKNINWFTNNNLANPNMSQFLDLVALGTIADNVKLDYNNRILIYNGMKIIRSNKIRPGIKALFKISKCNHINSVSSDISFMIVPKINAAGRLDDMSLGIDCLLAKELSVAEQLAKKLNTINNERKLIETNMQKQALLLLKNENSKLTSICIFEKSWHQGVLGILSGRLKERYHKPTIVFTDLNEQEIIGSARSIDELHIYKILNNISIQNPKMINKFGGHAMAAGLTLFKKNYESFVNAFNKEIQLNTTNKILQKKIYIDGELPNEYFCIDTAKLLKESGPWGIGFEEPTFVGNFTVINQNVIKKRHLKLILNHPDIKEYIAAINFNTDSNLLKNVYSKIKIVYRLNVDEYNNQLQLVVNEVILP